MLIASAFKRWRTGLSPCASAMLHKTPRPLSAGHTNREVDHLSYLWRARPCKGLTAQWSGERRHQSVSLAR